MATFKNTKGGKAIKFAPNAWKFYGQTHEQTNNQGVSGIQTIPPGGKSPIEVTDGESATTIDGKPYIFSQNLKYGGLPYSTHFDRLTKSGGTASQISSLAQMQEQQAGRAGGDAGRVMATGGHPAYSSIRARANSPIPTIQNAENNLRSKRLHNRPNINSKMFNRYPKLQNAKTTTGAMPKYGYGGSTFTQGIGAMVKNQSGWNGGGGGGGANWTKGISNSMEGMGESKWTQSGMQAAGGLQDNMWTRGGAKASGWMKYGGVPKYFGGGAPGWGGMNMVAGNIKDTPMWNQFQRGQEGQDPGMDSEFQQQEMIRSGIGRRTPNTYKYGGMVPKYHYGGGATEDRYGNQHSHPHPWNYDQRGESTGTVKNTNTYTGPMANPKNMSIEQMIDQGIPLEFENQTYNSSTGWQGQDITKEVDIVGNEVTEWEQPKGWSALEDWEKLQQDGLRFAEEEDYNTVQAAQNRLDFFNGTGIHEQFVGYSGGMDDDPFEGGGGRGNKYPGLREMQQNKQIREGEIERNAVKADKEGYSTFLSERDYTLSDMQNMSNDLKSAYANYVKTHKTIVSNIKEETGLVPGDKGFIGPSTPLSMYDWSQVSTGTSSGGKVWSPHMGTWHNKGELQIVPLRVGPGKGESSTGPENYQGLLPYGADIDESAGVTQMGGKGKFFTKAGGYILQGGKWVLQNKGGWSKLPTWAKVMVGVGSVGYTGGTIYNNYQENQEQTYNYQNQLLWKNGTLIDYDDENNQNTYFDTSGVIMKDQFVVDPNNPNDSSYLTKDSIFSPFR